MARRMAGDGLVTVSLRRSMTLSFIVIAYSLFVAMSLRGIQSDHGVLYSAAEKDFSLLLEMTG
jgi:hypothetical protein